MVKFSALDIIGQEMKLIANRKEYQKEGLWCRTINSFLLPRNPKYTLIVNIPEYLYIRSISFCKDIEEEVGEKFETKDLAKILYQDFLKHFRRKNDLHYIYNRLVQNNLAFPKIKPYQTEESYEGVLFEETRGFEELRITLKHQDALKGEFILRDMLDIYSEHEFTLENIIEIVYSSFIDDYRKSLIKNPIDKILQYV